MYDINTFIANEKVPQTKVSRITVQSTYANNDIISAIYHNTTVRDVMTKIADKIVGFSLIDVFVSLSGEGVELYFEEILDEVSWDDYQIGCRDIQAIRYNGKNLSDINDFLKEKGMEETVGMTHRFNILFGGVELPIGSWVVYINGRVEIMSSKLFDDLVEPDDGGNPACIQACSSRGL